jgi:lipopolysaccharide/colanic/teichoic acid biosynthesis glycosyltransferase
MIGKTREESVNFHLVPSTLEVIIGKGSIDSLNEVPLVQISYNIGQPMHRFTKRLFDFLLSCLLLAAVYPIFRISGRTKNPSRYPFVAKLPSVAGGEMSFVGPPADIKGASGQGLFVGKAGLTGLVQLQSGNRLLTKEEIDQMNLYYARNQSVMLDVEILIKSWLKYRSKRNG